MTEYDRFAVTLDVVIRPCLAKDLPGLEWYGVFYAHRELIAAMYQRHLRGESIMLVVEANRVASGQAWIDLDRLDEDATAVLWAVRIFPNLQNRGIGTRLLRVCEALAKEHGAERMEASVEQDNPGARRLYECCGYRVEDRISAEHAVSTPGWHQEGEVSRQWLLRKQLL